MADETPMRVEKMDLTLFDRVPSQTSAADRRSLLAIQRAVAGSRPAYRYWEIGSHLGGTLQPHLADPRCRRIVSIDPRPTTQPDDRASGYVAHYADNSSQRMLNLLARAQWGDIRRIDCIESDASAVSPDRAGPVADLAFIDGEHTHRAVLSDFAFCRPVLKWGGVVAFHDFSKVHGAIREICHSWWRQGGEATAVKLDGDVFALFGDRMLVAGDPYLASCARTTAGQLLWCSIKRGVRGFVPDAMVRRWTDRRAA